MDIQSLIARYDNWFFDCDGVILDSNQIKADAFFATAIPYGEPNAQQLRRYHEQNGGVSRYEKFRYFIETILARPFDATLHRTLCQNFADTAEGLLLNCLITAGAIALLEELRTANKQLYIVSGGDQSELERLFAKRNLAVFFKEILGSPRDKKDLVSGLQGLPHFTTRSIFIGDAKTDVDVAEHYDLDVLFMRQYSLDQVFFEKHVRSQLPWLDNFTTPINNVSKLRGKER